MNRMTKCFGEAAERTLKSLRTCSFLFIMLISLGIAVGLNTGMHSWCLAEDDAEKTVILDAIHDPSALDGFAYPDHAEILRIFLGHASTQSPQPLQLSV